MGPDLVTLSAMFLSLSEMCQEMSSLCTDIAREWYTSDIDTITLARAIQGEGAAMFGKERDAVATWIAHVAYNRWEKPYWKKIDGVDCTFSARIEKDWHGTENVEANELELWALRIAHQVSDERKSGGIDLANGALFAMSLEDLRMHGWLDRARQMTVHAIANPDAPLTQFWFLVGYPGEEIQ